MTALPGRLHPALREIPRDQLEMPTALRFGNQSVECQENCETCQPLKRGPDGPYIENDQGVAFWPTLNYAFKWARAVSRSSNCPIALTFGYAPGRVREDPVYSRGGLRSQRYKVLRLCIPKSDADLAKSLGDLYGIGVIASTDTAVLQEA